jgi:hypothetical protein
LYYKVNMTSFKRALAALECLLVFPAALFMTALFVRNLQPAPYEPAETARRVVEWFSVRPKVGLGVLLIALPLAAFVTGGIWVLLSWKTDADLRQAVREACAVVRANFATLLIAGATLVAGSILAIVALHVITD